MNELEQLKQDINSISTYSFLAVQNLAEGMNILKPIIDGEEKQIDGDTLKLIFHFMAQARVLVAQSFEKTKEPVYRKSEHEIAEFHMRGSE